MLKQRIGVWAGGEGGGPRIMFPRREPNVLYPVHFYKRHEWLCPTQFAWKVALIGACAENRIGKDL